MDFLFINTRELSSLMGLTYIQQSAYLLGIRPYMDRKTFIVGIKRRISYQSLAEALYIEPHPGIKSGSPTRPQLRRVIKSLERAGLVEIQSSEMYLILKCLLADADYPVQNKAITNPSPKVVMQSNLKNQDAAEGEGKQFAAFAWKYVNIVAICLEEMNQSITYKSIAFYISRLEQLLMTYTDKILPNYYPDYHQQIEQIIEEHAGKIGKKK